MSAVVRKHLAVEKKSVQMNELLFPCWCALTFFYFQTFVYKCNFCSLVEKCSSQRPQVVFFFFLPVCKLTGVVCSFLQHNSILGSVFADFYDQQLPSIQASALSQQVQPLLCSPCFCLLSVCSEHMLDTVLIGNVKQFSFLSIVHFQLEQFNMIETPISSDSLYNQTSTLNYSQALMMGLTGGHCNLQDSQQLGYSNHSNIPNIILTGAALTPHIPFNLA